MPSQIGSKTPPGLHGATGPVEPDRGRSRTTEPDPVRREWFGRGPVPCFGYKPTI